MDLTDICCIAIRDFDDTSLNEKFTSYMETFKEF
jgi:hypothetical protein